MNYLAGDRRQARERKKRIVHLEGRKAALEELLKNMLRSLGERKCIAGGLLRPGAWGEIGP